MGRPLPALDPPAAGEVDVWAAALPLPRDTARALAASLSPQERERRDRFLAEAPRRQFVAGRCVLRWLLARYAGLPAAQVPLVVGPHGKPAWTGGPVAFSLSHTDGLLLVAVAAGMEVGIDVERRRPLADVGLLSRMYLARSERDGFDGSAEGFLRLWTCKEAAVKASGLGISAGWPALRLQVRGPQAVHARGPGCDGQVLVFEPRPGYVAAVAAARGPLRLRALRRPCFSFA